jgi:hypothetical protein
MLRGDQLGYLRAEALADDDHRPVDSRQDVAGLGGEGLQRRAARVVNRSAACAEPR